MISNPKVPHRRGMVPQRTVPLSMSAEYARPLLEELTRLGSNLELLWRQAAIETPLVEVLNGAVAATPSRKSVVASSNCTSEAAWHVSPCMCRVASAIALRCWWI